MGQSYGERSSMTLNIQLKDFLPFMVSFQIQINNTFPTQFQILSKQGYAYLQAKVLEQSFYFLHTALFKQIKQFKQTKVSQAIKSPWITMDAKGALHLPFA